MTSPAPPADAPRVLVFAPLPPPATGQSRVTASAVEALGRHAHVTVVNTADPSLVWRAPGHLPLARAARWTRSLASLRRALATRPDVVYLTPASSALGLVRDVASVGLVPRSTRIVAHIHVGDYRRLLDHPRLGAMARRMAKRFHRIVVPSRYAADSLAEVLGVPVQVVSNAVPSAVRVSLDEAEAKWMRPRRDVPHVAFVSHVIASKGYPLLADAARQLEDQGHRLRLTFAGAWPSAAEREAFEAELATSGRAGRWTVTGPIGAQEVRALLLDADAFAFPSTYPHESFGLAALEAMHAGCGVAAVRHAAIGELMHDGVEGRLSAPDVSSFATALAEVLDARESFGRAAARRARDAFDAGRIESSLVRAILG